MEKTAASKPFKDHLMVQDHFVAMQYIIDAAAKKEKLTLSMI